MFFLSEQVHEMMVNFTVLNQRTISYGKPSKRGRLGSFDKPEMLFNLEDLLQRANDLECLTEPFTNEEIDAIVAK
jgi:hypothetical protein